MGSLRLPSLNALTVLHSDFGGKQSTKSLPRINLLSPSMPSPMKMTSPLRTRYFVSHLSLFLIPHCWLDLFFFF
uniref:Uncharacterized protein n=1 Tax=Rhizophora mucronata TaxID=61149 RepID=A0A2P2M0K4_RHIMU